MVGVVWETAHLDPTKCRTLMNLISAALHAWNKGMLTSSMEKQCKNTTGSKACRNKGHHALLAEHTERACMPSDDLTLLQHPLFVSSALRFFSMHA